MDAWSCWDPAWVFWEERWFRVAPRNRSTIPHLRSPPPWSPATSASYLDQWASPVWGSADRNHSVCPDWQPDKNCCSPQCRNRPHFTYTLSGDDSVREDIPLHWMSRCACSWCPCLCLQIGLADYCRWMEFSDLSHPRGAAGRCGTGTRPPLAAWRHSLRLGWTSAI